MDDLTKKQKNTGIVLFLALIAMLLTGIILSNTGEAKNETIKETMKDAVVHDVNHINLLGMEVNPAVISAFTVTAILLVFAIIVRIFVIPRFKPVPGKFQMFLETWVSLFDGLAKGNSPHRNKFLGTYIFVAGTYIFTGTCFELFGAQAITTEGHPITLPAPLADINAAIAMGCFSYLMIVAGAIIANKAKGIGLALKEFSLPISMSFRLFGALLSGALVTELVYYYITLSFVLPVIVAVLFTLMHALIQAYVLTMLVSHYYGEVTEVHPKKEKKKKKKNSDTDADKAA